MSNESRRGLGGKPSYITDRDLQEYHCKYGGVPGPAGQDGKDGQDGRDGDRGLTGPEGPQGKQGCDGPQGIEGRRGVPGADGRNGCDGKDGRDGRDGDTGATGLTGPQGPKGCDGKDGAPGATGAQGAQGIQGVAGSKGETGDKGDQGEQGLPGEKGDTGLTGPEGPPGIQGEQGVPGDKGDTGETGPTGPAGTDGADGAAGGSVIDGTVDPNAETLTLNQSGGGGQIIIDISDLLNGTGGTGCCNTSFSGPVQNADGTLTITLNQSGGTSQSFTLPAYPTAGGTTGLVSCVAGTDAGGDFVQFQQGGVDLAGCKVYQNTGGTTDLSNLRVRCNTTATGFTIELVDTQGTLIVPSESGECPWPTGTPANPVTWTRRADPANPCVEQVVFSDGVQDDCIVAPYYEPMACAIYCVTVAAGDNVTVSLTSIDGYSITWGENGVDSQVAGGTSQSASYQYLTAGTYELKICQNSFCEGDEEEQTSDLEITGYQSISAKAGCGSCA